MFFLGYANVKGTFHFIILMYVMRRLPENYVGANELGFNT